MDLADVEGDALAIYSAYGFDPCAPPSAAALCRAIASAEPRRVRMRLPGATVDRSGELLVMVRRGLPDDVARFTLAHEVAEAWYDASGYSDADVEARCDALAAALLCPRPAYAEAMRVLGHRVHALASAFGVPQGCALLRIGEVSGRPVALIRSSPIVRGAPFAWPSSVRALVSAVRHPPRGVHPVRVDRVRWGLMARDA